MTRRRSRAAAVVVATALAISVATLTGCSASDESEPTPVSPPPAADARAPREIRLDVTARLDGPIESSMELDLRVLDGDNELAYVTVPALAGPVVTASVPIASSELSSAHQPLLDARVRQRGTDRLTATEPIGTDPETLGPIELLLHSSD